MTRNINYIGVPVAQINKRSSLSSVDLVPKLVEYTDYVSVSGNATTLLYGNWTQLIASTQYDTTYLSVNVSGVGANAVDTSALLDIATGAASSEQVIISSIPAGYALNTSSILATGSIGISLFFPIYIPKGSRISARLLAKVTNDTADVTIGLFQDLTGRAPKFIDTYGANTVSARGTNMPTTNIYTEVTASTTKPYSALIIAPAISGTTSMTTERSTYTLAIGSSGNEVIVGSMNVAASSQESIWNPISGPVGIYTGHYPSGTRISCKYSGTTRAYRDVIVYGVPYA